MHSEQKVCPQEVIMGVFINSLQTWQRIGDSTATKPERVVEAQSVASGTSKESMVRSICIDRGRKVVVVQLTQIEVARLRDATSVNASRVGLKWLLPIRAATKSKSSDDCEHITAGIKCIQVTTKEEHGCVCLLGHVAHSQGLCGLHLGPTGLSILCHQLRLGRIT